MNMVLEDEWHDDLDVTRVIQTPKIQSFTGQPDIPLESFNPSAHSDAPTSKERKVCTSKKVTYYIEPDFWVLGFLPIKFFYL